MSPVNLWFSQNFLVLFPFGKVSTGFCPQLRCSPSAQKTSGGSQTHHNTQQQHDTKVG